MPSKPRGAAGEPVATDGEAVQPSNAKTLPPPSTEGMHKEEERCWTKLIKSLEWFIEQEPDEGPRRENIIACLHFAREHGYPEDPYCLWAVDGVARCMEVLEHIKITSSDRDYFRHSFATLGGLRWLYCSSPVTSHHYQAKLSTMSQPKNSSNNSHVSTLELALEQETKDPVRKANINACLRKACETPDPIKWDQVIWAVNGKDAFIQDRLEQVLKVHTDHQAELKNGFALCLSGSTAMMAGPGSNSASSNPQAPPKGTAGGTALGRDKSRLFLNA